jgi:hypothetical protein
VVCLYRIKPDSRAGKLGMIRVIDESGSDYLYPKDHFGRIELPLRIARALAT